MEANSLTLDYINITIEPFADLSSDGLVDEVSGSRYHGDGWGGDSGGGSSGAGHGGHGGVGGRQQKVGISYGKYRRPTTFGSTGGAQVFPFTGGLGGGRFKIIAHDTLVVDGVLSSKGGNARASRSGGGSGGSILAYTSRIHGDGEFDVSGGNGDSSTGYHGGGGGAGRICLYYRENHFLGRFLGFGGTSSIEPGGPGTVFLENIPGMNATYGHERIDEAAHAERVLLDENVVNGTQWVRNRTLYANAMGRKPQSPDANLSSSYRDFSVGGSSRVWLILDDEDLEANGTDVELDELQLYGGAQLAIINPANTKAYISIVIGQMEGDRTGRIHLGFNQTFLSLQSYLPMDMIIYQGGLTTMQGELLVAGVTVEIDGVLRRCQNITVVDDGVIRMKEMYDLEGKPTEVKARSCLWIGFFSFSLETNTDLHPFFILKCQK